MPRKPRVVAPGVPHHITQRGNQRRDVFTSDEIRELYIRRLFAEAERQGLHIEAWCLMTNHVHILATPEHELSLARTIRSVHSRFAQYWNTVHDRIGHMWQNRYYSCPVQPHAAWRVVRYIEMNPVRSGLVPSAEDYLWSSAREHLDLDRERRVDVSNWYWTPGDWRDVLREAADGESLEIRRATFTGQPWGTVEFARALETRLGRRLLPRPGGRPPRAKAAVA